MLLVIIAGFVTMCIGLISLWYREYWKHSDLCSKYNGPTPIPVFGNTYRISSPQDVIPVFMEYLKAYGPVIRLWIGFRPRIIICDYKIAELLLSSNEILDKSYDYKFFEGWLGTGLLTSTGSKWRKQRKLLTPTFHFQILEKYISIFDKESDVLTQILSKVSNSEPINIYPFINLCTLDITYESVMGVEIRAQKEPNCQYVHSVADITEILLNRMFSILKTYDSYYRLTSDYRKEQELLKVLHGHTNFVINRREKEFSIRNVDETSRENGYGMKQRKAFLDLLLECREAGAKLTTENIREEVETFMFEGHDTTSSGVGFTLFCLAHNKEIQDKVVDEVRSVLESVVDTPLSYQKLQEMKYLEMVIKEGMRLYPPVPLIARELAKDTEFDGVLIPRGTNLTLFTYGLHRQEEVFSDPEKFDPERFTLENSAERSPFSYVPFSAGIRNCIGQRFAMFAMKAIISKILLNFEVLPVEGFVLNLSTEAILRSKNGIWLRLQERKR